MRNPDHVNVQMTHKEEGKSHIKADSLDREAILEKLSLCIDPLRPAEHPNGLLNIATGEVMTNDAINVDRSIEIGKQQLQ